MVADDVAVLTQVHVRIVNRPWRREAAFRHGQQEKAPVDAGAERLVTHDKPAMRSVQALRTA
jgi:hypothetical protein